jgi:hypothetical protein
MGIAETHIPVLQPTQMEAQGKTAAICTFHIMSLYCMSLSPGFSSLSCSNIAASYAFHAAFIRLLGKQHNVHSALANLLILRIQGKL